MIDGVRKFAMDVRELDIDLIDRINPFEAAYAILAKSMNEETLKQVQAVIAAKRVSIPYEEARDLARARAEVQAGTRPAAGHHFAPTPGKSAWPRALLLLARYGRRGGADG